ncbi:MAG: L-glyceraldehyde 3-phosphate reductase [Spirochaetes bacterium GWF1_41_5]|nr:MAG: L-glyceraldehyde 3-phosphate reductase [Spirochaetes bacterium GWF1_41_5]HBE03400.1 L-glyceraldehyde 3-phosphate reductase [Spirochaetia bacterium]
MQISDHKGIPGWHPDENRYNLMPYRRTAASGLKFPALSFGLWHNFGDCDDLHRARLTLRSAFDHGITHFDLANNYGPPYGSAEENFGKIFRKDFLSYRHELLISSKAGYDMWPGPYGRGGSKKYLLTSIEQSLKRTGLEYFDIFYHHCPDPETPLEETALALLQILRQGKAIYAGISNYDHEKMHTMQKLMQSGGSAVLVNQIKYSLLNRSPEKNVLAEAEKLGIAVMAFSPLAQGILTDRYLDGIPENSRAGKDYSYLKLDKQPENLERARKLAVIAGRRGQSLARMAVAWLLRNPGVTSVLIGASSPEQIKDNVRAVENISFSDAELSAIEAALTGI